MSRDRYATDHYCRKCGGKCKYVEPATGPGRAPVRPFRVPSGANALAAKIHPRLCGFADAKLHKLGLDRSVAQDLVQGAWARWLSQRPRGLYRAEESVRRFIEEQAVGLWRRERADPRYEQIDLLDQWTVALPDESAGSPSAGHRASRGAADRMRHNADAPPPPIRKWVRIFD